LRRRTFAVRWRTIQEEVGTMSHSLEARDTQEEQDQRGQTPEFSDVFEEYQRPIHGYLLRMTENEAEAEDLTQEVFLRVHRSLSTFRGESSLKTWLYRIASNVFFDHTRKASTRQAGATSTLEGTLHEGEEWEDKEAPQPDQLAAQSEMSACVQEHVEALPDDYKAVLVLHDDQGLKNREIAEALGCSEATVKIRLHRAREKLRASLNTGCDFSRDERNVFVCERKAPDEGCQSTGCAQETPDEGCQGTDCGG
jgi:RNA polymerase sigma-70 factor (ECF subfamily)